MDFSNILLQVVMIPRWFIAIIYLLTAISFMFIHYMPFSIKVSISIPIFIGGITYLFAQACKMETHNLTDFANLSIMSVMLITSLIYIFSRYKEKV